MKLRFKRKFEETLSEGRGMQLLWLLIIILVVVLLFWGIVAFVLKDSSMGWQELLALFLDPGSFGGAGSHDAFRLIATLLGMFLFSALLISVVGNIFENISVAFKDGRSRYKHEGHVLILGGGHHLFSMLNALLEDSFYGDADIVVLTTSNVEELRSRIFALPFLTREKEKALRRRLTLYFGERDNVLQLERKRLARKAKAIYIIGEDNEIDHDSVSIRSYEKLSGICMDAEGIIRGFMILQDPASMDVFKYVAKTGEENKSKLKLDIIDADEYVAERVLVEDHDGIDVVPYPKLDGEGIKESDDCHVHLVVAGTTGMARAMALTTAHICHFPNYEKGRRRTVITIIDTDMRAKMNRFIASLPSLFLLSHYKYIAFDEAGKAIEEKHVPDVSYGDFLDVEWQFIDAELQTPGVRSLLAAWAKDETQKLSLAICLDRQEDCTMAALHLPKDVYGSGCSIFVHQQDYGDILGKAQGTNQFGNLYTFGMASDYKNDDPLFICRAKRGQRVNFVYDQAYGGGHKDEESAWFDCKEADKYSSIYCANAMTVRARSFGLNESYDPLTLSEEQRSSIFEVEHRRWVMSELILGFAPFTLAERKQWKEGMVSSDKEAKEEAKAYFKKMKKNHFCHMDIMPYDDLLPNEKDKDAVIIDEMKYILTGEGD